MKYLKNLVKFFIISFLIVFFFISHFFTLKNNYSYGINNINSEFIEILDLYGLNDFIIVNQEVELSSFKENEFDFSDMTKEMVASQLFNPNRNHSMISNYPIDDSEIKVQYKGTKGFVTCTDSELSNRILRFYSAVQFFFKKSSSGLIEDVNLEKLKKILLENY